MRLFLRLEAPKIVYELQPRHGPRPAPLDEKYRVRKLLAVDMFPPSISRPLPCW
ncbi:MAG: hypothetical protein IPJ00_19135 [Saprospirales bacterium]|nr:hypothetical protein [Saprospirales bacterium]